MQLDNGRRAVVSGPTPDCTPADIPVVAQVDPVLGTDDYATTRDTSLSVAAPGVLANDNPGGALSVATHTSTADGGVVAVQPDGSFTYLPPAGFVGTDRFRYVVVGDAGPRATTVTISVTDPLPPNQPPTAQIASHPPITLPATASLQTTITDDGLPTGSTPTIAWTKVSGPGTATFTPGAPTNNVHPTTVSVTAPGTHVLRVTVSDGELTASADTTVVVNAPLVWPTMGPNSGLVAGTYTESPNRIGPLTDSNGTIYFVNEPIPATPLMRIVASTDGGRTWHEVDAVNRPAVTDQESIDVHQRGSTLYIAHQRSGGNVYFHTFHTSDHPSTPSRWGVRAETVATAATDSEQSVVVGARADGTVVLAYTLQVGTAYQLALRTRATTGTWSAPTIVDAAAGNFFGQAGVLGDDDRLHLFYASHSQRALYYRVVATNGTLGPRLTIATDVGNGTASRYRIPVIPPVYHRVGSSETISVAYLRATNHVAVATIRDGALTATTTVSDRPVAADYGASRQPIASLVGDGGNLYLLYSDATTLDVIADRNLGEAGWGTDVTVLSNVSAHWIRGGIVRAPGSPSNSLGFVWDMGSFGDVGDSHYDEIRLS